MNLKRILAATDFSALGDAAIHRAIVLAAREEGELVILHAMPKPSVLEDAFGRGGNLPARAPPVQPPRRSGYMYSRVQGKAVRPACVCRLARIW